MADMNRLLLWVHITGNFTEAARQIGVTPNMLASWLSGARPVKLLERIAVFKATGGFVRPADLENLRPLARIMKDCPCCGRSILKSEWTIAERIGRIDGRGIAEIARNKKLARACERAERVSKRGHWPRVESATEIIDTWTPGDAEGSSETESPAASKSSGEA